MNKHYFSHDHYARTDEKLQEVLMKMGYEGIGYYWSMVEMMHEQGGKLELDKCESIAFAMRMDTGKLKMLISLIFEKDDTYFWSDSVLKRIKMQEEKSKKAKKSAQKRWKNEAKKRSTTTNNDVMPTHSDSNAIKEKKIKEIKVNEIKEDIRASQNYFQNVPLKDFEDIEITEKQLLLEAEKAFNWLKSKGERKKDYKAYLRNWVLKNFRKRLESTPTLAEKYEVDENNVARLKEMKSGFSIGRSM